MHFDGMTLPTSGPSMKGFLYLPIQCSLDCQKHQTQFSLEIKWPQYVMCAAKMVSCNIDSMELEERHKSGQVGVVKRGAGWSWHDHI